MYKIRPVDLLFEPKEDQYASEIAKTGKDPKALLVRFVLGFEKTSDEEALVKSVHVPITLSIPVHAITVMCEDPVPDVKYSLEIYKVTGNCRTEKRVINDPQDMSEPSIIEENDAAHSTFRTFYDVCKQDLRYRYLPLETVISIVVHFHGGSVPRFNLVLHGIGIFSTKSFEELAAGAFDVMEPKAVVSKEERILKWDEEWATNHSKHGVQ